MPIEWLNAPTFAWSPRLTHPTAETQVAAWQDHEPGPGLTAKEKGRSGFPKRPVSCSQKRNGLTLRELEGLACLGTSVLLALHDAAVARQEAMGLQDGAKRRLIMCQSMGKTVADRAGLARKA